MIYLRKFTRERQRKAEDGGWVPRKTNTSTDTGKQKMNGNGTRMELEHGWRTEGGHLAYGYGCEGRASW